MINMLMSTVGGELCVPIDKYVKSPDGGNGDRFGVPAVWESGSDYYEAVGAPSTANGTVYIFKNGVFQNSVQGSSGDGNKFGALLFEVEGAVYTSGATLDEFYRIYHNGTSWVKSTISIDTTGLSFGGFAWLKRFAGGGGKVVVGVSDESSQASASGVLIYFSVSGNTLTQEHYFRHPNPTSSAALGRGLVSSLDGNVVFSQCNNNDVGSLPGDIHAFKFNSGTGQYEHADEFDLLVEGFPNSNIQLWHGFSDTLNKFSFALGNNVVYVLDWDGNNLSYNNFSISAPNGGNFGASGCLSGSSLYVAAPTGGADGEAYRFDLLGPTPTVPVATYLSGQSGSSKFGVVEIGGIGNLPALNCSLSHVAIGHTDFDGNNELGAGSFTSIGRFRRIKICA